jgi:5-methylcytosine-specific restriction protein B
MSYADDVRKYCKDNIIDPARTGGEKQIAIRAGDIHTAMGYQRRMPLVCAALGANKFEEIAGVERVSITGPTHGANAIFTFWIR